LSVIRRCEDAELEELLLDHPPQLAINIQQSLPMKKMVEMKHDMIQE
jgi:hypothetical protein